MKINIILPTVYLLVCGLLFDCTVAQQLIVDGDGKIVGSLDLAENMTDSNLAIGLGAGINMGALDKNNSYIGYSCGDLSEGWKFNTGLGRGVLLFNYYGSSNTAAGYNALNRCESSGNTVIGSLALSKLTASTPNNNNSFNTVLGYSAGVNLENGSDNTFLGSLAGRDMESGYDNVLIGQACGLERTGGITSVYIGHSAGRINNGYQNIIIGENAARNNDGSNNIIIGYQAAINQSLDSNMLWIENSSGPTPLIYGNFNSDRIGINCTSPSAELSVVGDIKATGSITQLTTACSSDAQFKKEVRALEPSHHKIQMLKPVKYRWKTNINPQKEEKEQLGFIAQEVEKIFPELVYTDQEGFKSLDYSRLTVPLTLALIELDKEINELEKTQLSLEHRLDCLIK